MAHDFNNVLAVVQGWASIGLEPSVDGRTRQEAADAVDSAVRQGAALARQLLALGKRTVRTIGTHRVADVVETSAKALRRVLPEDVELILDSEGDARVDADETELQQLLFNLVINARDAMPTGGKLRITTGVESWSTARAVEGGTLPPGQWAFVDVRDSGAGIPPEIRARVFEPFFTTKPVGSGTGLGLWTVLSIVKASAGGLVLESQVGAGTTFRVYFPARAQDAQVADVRTAAPSAKSVRAGHILVLEDNELVLRLTRDILASHGHDVLAVSNGTEAVEAIHSSSTPFDLLCTDAVVPHGPVREVIEAFERTRPGGPVLVVSGYVEEELTRRGIEQGRYHLLRKPFRPADLVVTIDELLGRASPTALGNARSSASSAEPAFSGP
jgi:CheY-like chemotaxis protein